MKPWVKKTLWVLVALGVVFVAIQFIPVGTPMADTPETNPFQWSSPEAKAIAVKACYDCHSTQPRIWWAVQIAPFKWLAQSDLARGTAVLNFSNWTGGSASDVAETVNSGEMAPFYYVMAHADAKLTDAEKKTLLDSFNASLSNNKTAAVPAEVTTIMKASCNSCHPDSVSLAYRATSAAQAQAEVQKMIGKGAKLTAAQAATLVAFYQSPAAAAAASSTAAATTPTAIIAASCSSCHSARPALNYHTTDPARALAMINNMAKRGAAITDAQKQVLVTYYTK